MLSSEEDVFEYLKKYKVDHGGVSPSYDEIAKDLGLGKTTVRYHLENLEEKGKIRIIAIRSIQVLGETYSIPEEE